MLLLTCAIIDDEPLAAGLLEGYVQKTPYLELRGTYHSAVSAMASLRESPVQLLFLDIQMPELNGTEFTKILPSETKVIFTTAFPSYAVEGFQLGALDYLLKPISYEEFLRSTNKALEWFTLVHRQELYDRDRFMLVKSDYKLLRINLDDILFVEGLKDYVRFYLKDGSRVMSLMSMRRLEDSLPHPEFLRTHRSYIVHMPAVTVVDRLRIVFGEHYIPISENYKESVLAYIEAHTLT